MSSPKGATPAGWRADVQASPLRGWSDLQLAALAATIAGVVADWNSDWGLATSPAEVGCKPPEPGCGTEPWQCLGGAGDSAAWMTTAGFEASQLAASLFGGTPQITTVLAEIGTACRSDAIARLRAALPLAGGGSAPDEPSAWTLSRWGGSVVVRLPFGARLLLGGALVKALVGTADAAHAARPLAPAAQVPIDRALSAFGFKVQVQLEGCELAVGSLQDLQVGDVVRLRHRLDAPAAVTMADGAHLCSGYLARSRGRKTVELAAARA